MVRRLFSFPNRVNERAARLVAAAVVALIATAYLTGTPWMVAVVAAGFLARVAWGPRFSLLARGATAAAPKLWPVKSVAGAPKRFAQGIGAVFTVTASVLFAFGHPGLAWSLAGVVGLFASLEAAAGFCAGCFAYGQLQRLGVIGAEACPDCAPDAAPAPLEAGRGAE
ncbi:MAG: DUF4395 domain-containing protein [Myxococcaceae bacterium]